MKKLLFSSCKRLGSCDKFQLKGDGHLLGEGHLLSFQWIVALLILAKFLIEKQIMKTVSQRYCLSSVETVVGNF